MITIIAGSRGITNYSKLCEAIESSGFEVSEVVSGGARGVDALGEQWALDRRGCVALTVMPAEWNKHGKAAGFIRNEEMAQYAEALVALWDGHSPGTKHMIETARKYKLPVYVQIVETSARTGPPPQLPIGL